MQFQVGEDHPSDGDHECAQCDDRLMDADDHILDILLGCQLLQMCILSRLDRLCHRLGLSLIKPGTGQSLDRFMGIKGPCALVGRILEWSEKRFIIPLRICAVKMYGGLHPPYPALFDVGRFKRSGTANGFSPPAPSPP